MVVIATLGMFFSAVAIGLRIGLLMTYDGYGDSRLTHVLWIIVMLGLFFFNLSTFIRYA